MVDTNDTDDEIEYPTIFKKGKKATKKGTFDFLEEWWEVCSNAYGEDGTETNHYESGIGWRKVITELAGHMSKDINVPIEVCEGVIHEFFYTHDHNDPNDFSLVRSRIDDGVDALLPLIKRGGNFGDPTEKKERLRGIVNTLVSDLTEEDFRNSYDPKSKISVINKKFEEETGIPHSDAHVTLRWGWAALTTKEGEKYYEERLENYEDILARCSYYLT